ncbi:hypothetical protein HZB02_03620 [Candidatus Woesearchaeota archaeon]|nr:hypothetical protein [Candidatus Woesearchaeota archaeon]
MAEQSLLLQFTGEMPLFKVLDFLVENKGMEFTKEDIAKGAQISRASLFNYWDNLERYGMVKVTRQAGKQKFYTLDNKSIIVKKMLDLERALIAESLERDAEKHMVVA